MENNHDIDKTFSDASKTEEPATFPGFEKVWSSVEEKLDQKKEKKKVFPMWISYGIAASLLIGFGIFYFNDKDETPIAKSAIVQNEIPKSTAVSAPESIQEIDSTVKANIQKDILPPEPSKMAFQQAPTLASPPLSSPVFETAAPQAPQHDDMVINSGRTADTLGRQSLEEVVLLGAQRKKTAMISESTASSSKVKISGLSGVADTADVNYPSVFASKAPAKEPEILAYNKEKMNLKKAIAASDQGNKTGSKVFVNSLNGSAAGVKINSISGKPNSGQVDMSISIRGSAQAEKNPMVVIDGKISDIETFRTLDPKKIEAVTVLKGDKAVSLFSGENARNGVIVVITKSISEKEKKRLYKLLENDETKNK